MSDSFHDAYRADNKPKGFGWWSEERQREYLQKIFDRGDRDEWLIYRMYWLDMLTIKQARECLGIPEPDTSQGRLL